MLKSILIIKRYLKIYVIFCSMPIARKHNIVLRYRLMENTQIKETEKNDSHMKKRGRPPKGGEPTLIRLTLLERSIAQNLGDGVIAEGIRLALLAVARIGDSATRALAQGPHIKSEKTKD